MTALIWVNPNLGFGAPCIRGTGVQTSVVLSRWLAGETANELADDYVVPVKSIEAAVYFELGRSRSRAAREAVEP